MRDEVGLADRRFGFDTEEGLVDNGAGDPPADGVKTEDSSLKVELAEDDSLSLRSCRDLVTACRQARCGRGSRENAS